MQRIRPPADDEPRIRPARTPEGTVDGRGPGIAIPFTKATTPVPGHRPDPIRYWDAYYKKHDEDPKQLLETLELLKQDKKYADIEAVLHGYLTYRTKQAEPWMYAMYAVAIEQRKGPSDEVKTYLGYAAYQARKSKNPNHLVSVADMLYRRGIFDQVGPPGQTTTAGELIDLAAKAIPHRAEPLMMSVNVAAKSKDPKRMGDAVESLLSLGWPGIDDRMRKEARGETEALAKALREDGRNEEADALLARLPQALARDLYVALKWTGVDDLDLVVDEPLGATAQLFKNPRTIFGGAIVSNGFGSHPEEVYVCPRAFSGAYTIRVDKIYQPEKRPATTAVLEIITHEGTPEEKREVRKVDLARPEPVVVRLDGGRRKEVMPFLAPPAEARLPADAKAVAPSQPAPKETAKPANPGGAAIRP